jgi:hypothetical protein
MKNELTERQRQHWTQDYRVNYERGEKALKDWIRAKNIPHFYSINVTPHMHLVHDQNIWYDIDRRDRYTKGLWFYLLQRLNRQIDNNFQRKPHQTIQHQVVIEHYDRHTNNLIKPHLHGTIAVPDFCHDQFRALLRETSNEIFEINLDALKGDFSAIRSTQIRYIQDEDNLKCWIGYVMKEQFSGKHYEDKNVERRTGNEY